MPRELRTDLVVSKPEVGETQCVGHQSEWIRLVGTAVAGEEEEALFRNEVVQLELPELEVDPVVVPQIVEADERGFKVESAGVIGGGQQREGNVLVQRARRPQVHAGEIEPGLRDRSRDKPARRIPGDGVYRLLSGAFSVPVRRDAERDGDV